MSNSLFVEIKEVVTQLIKDKEEILESKNIITETIENTEERLYIILNFGECMASIVVAEPDFAPYRFVAFESGIIVNGIHEIVYTWYDDEGVSINEIVKNLNYAIDVVLEYNNEILS